MKKYVTFMAMFAALRTLQRCVRGRTVHILTVLACEWGRVGSGMVYTPPPPLRFYVFPYLLSVFVVCHHSR